MSRQLTKLFAAQAEAVKTDPIAFEKWKQVYKLKNPPLTENMLSNHMILQFPVWIKALVESSGGSLPQVPSQVIQALNQ